MAGTREKLTTVAAAARVQPRSSRPGRHEFPEFTAAKAGGPRLPSCSCAPAALPLTRGVQGCSHNQRLSRASQKVVAEVTRQLAMEQGWVLGIDGRNAQGVPRSRPTRTLIDDVRRLYLTEYRDTWKAFIADIKPIPPTSLAQSLERTRFWRPRLAAAAADARHVARNHAAGGSGRGRQAAGPGGKQGGRNCRRVCWARPATTGAPGERIEHRRRRVRQLRFTVAAPEGGKAPLETTIARLGELQRYHNVGGLGAQKVVARRRRQPAAADQDRRRQRAWSPSARCWTTWPATVRACRRCETARRPVARGAGPGGRVLRARRPRPAATRSRSTRHATSRWMTSPSCSARTASSTDADQAGAVMWTPRASPGRSGRIGRRAAGRRRRYLAAVPARARRSSARPSSARAAASSPPSSNSSRWKWTPALLEITIDIDSQIVRYAHGPGFGNRRAVPGTAGHRRGFRVMAQPQGPPAWWPKAPGPRYRLFDRVSIQPGASPGSSRRHLRHRRAQSRVRRHHQQRAPFRLPELRGFSARKGL